MADNNQTYQVQYNINVDASKGTQQVQAFADSIGNLTKFKLDVPRAVANIKGMMDEIDKVFRSKGKKKNYSYKFNIDTSSTEEKLGRVKVLLGEIDTLTKGIKLVINAGKPVNTKAVKAEAKKLVDKKAKEGKTTPNIQSLHDAQKNITKIVGKVNSAFISLERGREVNIKTDVAKQRLTEILGLMRQIRSAGAGMQLGGALMNRSGKGGSLLSIPNSQITPYILPQNVQNRIQEKLQLRRQRDIQRREQQDAQRRTREEEKREKQNASNIIRQNRQQLSRENSAYSGNRRAAINRLQYSKGPSMRSIPFAYMFNAYMAYGMIKRELSEAVEYANIMESARSILKVADSDLSTFNTRFDEMARHVRQIGVETKFTAIEIGGAVKYLSMAGMNIDTINKSIRPITNLALIGDNDVAQIADLTTNIMAGYDIKSSSMNSVADIIASSVSRSNVNIVEMAESYKMAAGYLKLSGVEFSESAAAIGVLGNMGIKGTQAGTSLRAMSTRFAKPTKEARKVLDRLDIKFTEFHDIYGEKVEKLRPLADIFEELDKKGATLEDMISIFSKIGGTAGMMFLQNHEKLRELASQNRVSHGISGELADVKQNTTKGLWYQMTSQFSESFMQGYELLEPQIRSVLKDLLAKFNAKEFANGLASIGRVLIDIVSTLASVGTWFTKNFHWIEPILFTGIVATKLFKLAGALTNVGVALGFIGKQSAASTGFQMIGGLAGFGGIRGIGAMSMANKRQLVTALNAAGITGKGNLTRALAQSGVTNLFASQVATGNGLIGAGASISALGAGAVAATVGITALVGALGWVAYKTWKVKEAKDAVIEEINSNRKYQYPSIDALYESLNKTYKEAVNTKWAIDQLTSGKTLEEESGQKIGAFSSNWWSHIMNAFAVGNNKGFTTTPVPVYTADDAYQDDAVQAIYRIAEKDMQNHITSAWAEFGKFKTADAVAAFMQNIDKKYKQGDETLDSTLFTKDRNGKVKYVKDFGDKKAIDATKTPHYQQFQNDSTVSKIRTGAQAYMLAIKDFSGAKNLIEKTDFSFKELEENGYYRNVAGQWVMKDLPKNSSSEARIKQEASKMDVHDKLVRLTSVLRTTLGGSTEAAENVMKAAGFNPKQYSNEPQFNTEDPTTANGITTRTGEDDGSAGGNYSGTGKLSSAAPKQVIVNISSLLSIATVDLLKSKDGQTAEVQNLKEQLAQALIDVVHDFDASWNG